MYIRWKLRARHTRAGKYGWPSEPKPPSLCAILVSAERVNGQPRQRYVRHLGSIRTGALGSAMARLTFWEQVERTLGALGEDVERYRAAIATRVPHPTPEEVSADRAEFERWAASLHAMCASRGWGTKRSAYRSRAGGVAVGTTKTEREQEVIRQLRMMTARSRPATAHAPGQAPPA